MQAGESVPEIVRRSKSNLAFALLCLPRDRRTDMRTFYAFCRIVDDIADEPGPSSGQKRALLDRWKMVVLGDVSPGQEIEAAVMDVVTRRAIPREELAEIIRGVEMDIEPLRFPTFADLQVYTRRVAGAVGLVSTRIFGCQDPQARDYALALGDALQLTNILRDVRLDWINGERVYLPLEDLEKFGVKEADIASGRMDDNMRRLFAFEIARAREFYAQATRLLPAVDRHKLTAARAMHRIYESTLNLLEADGCRVFEKRYALSRWRKALCLTSAAVHDWWARILGK